MKKLFYTALMVLCVSLGAQHLRAQTVSKTASTPVLVTDTLHYYLNKYFFKTGTTNLGQYPYLKCPAATASAITHCGSKFEVPAGETVTITGLEAYIQKKGNPESGPNSIYVHLYLCTLTAQGMPGLPAVDSVSILISGLAMPSPSLIGGNFTTPRVFTSDYAVLCRNLSGTSDTVRLLRTDGTVPSGNANYSDGGYSFVRYLGQFHSTKNFTLSPGFGNGTDYEFMVAPRVQYMLQASQLMPHGAYLISDPTAADTLCTRTVMTFTNTSSKFYEHRMYNLNHFYLKWALTGPFNASALTMSPFSQDSAITWKFDAYSLTRPSERVFLPYVNSGTIDFATDRASTIDPPDYCYTTNQFRARLRPMGIMGKRAQLVYNEDFKICLMFCNGDAVGISAVKGFENLNVFPNPLVNGKTRINGLKGRNSIVITDILGRQVNSISSEAKAVEIDLGSQPEGTYFITIVSVETNNKAVVRIVR